MPGYVSCEESNCIYRSRDDDLYPLCMAPVIELCGRGGTYECSSYRDYHDLEEYQEPFFKAVKTENGPGRLPCRGKRIEINGRVFYTDSHPSDVDKGYADLTHGMTGMFVGLEPTLRARWEKFEEAINLGEYKPVVELPPAEPIEEKKGKDGHVYRYRLVQPEASDV